MVLYVEITCMRMLQKSIAMLCLSIRVDSSCGDKSFLLCGTGIVSLSCIFWAVFEECVTTSSSSDWLHVFVLGASEVGSRGSAVKLCYDRDQTYIPTHPTVDSPKAVDITTILFPR